MNLITSMLVKLGILKRDLDYHFFRASMVIIYLFFGYQKWFPYEAQGLIPYISHGPLTFWMYPVFGIRGATLFLGVSEWVFGALLSSSGGVRLCHSLRRGMQTAARVATQSRLADCLITPELRTVCEQHTQFLSRPKQSRFQGPDP
ncbi:MAG: DUF417 family protein [Candidatus Acidiferrum sp.]